MRLPSARRYGLRAPLALRASVRLLQASGAFLGGLGAGNGRPGGGSGGGLLCLACCGLIWSLVGSRCHYPSLGCTERSRGADTSAAKAHPLYPLLVMPCDQPRQRDKTRSIHRVQASQQRYGTLTRRVDDGAAAGASFARRRPAGAVDLDAATRRALTCCAEPWG